MRATDAEIQYYLVSSLWQRFLLSSMPNIHQIIFKLYTFAIENKTTKQKKNAFR